VLAATLAVGSLLSARLVVRMGLARLVRAGSAYLLATALLLAALAWATDGRPSLWTYGVAMSLLLPGIAVVIPSCNTAAMAPLGHVAGMGAAILGTVSTAGGALLGTLTDAAFDGTMTPFAEHVLAYAAVGGGVILLLGRPQPVPAIVVEPVAA
jgi:DHA1 family bicyclomycin/chloramphenicol resistance-like MFS transporter